MSHFADLPPTPSDPAFFLVAAFAADDFSAKVDLCPGFYRDENANPWVLPCVRKAKQLLHEDSTLDHEHLPLSGHPALIAGARKLAFGANQDDLSRVATIQTVSGTGSNHLGARFLSEALAPARKTVWISDPSWINHSEIWLNVNASIIRRTYPYFARNTQSLDFEGMKKTLLQEGVAGDIVILHACAHNPTGLDLTPEQWTAIADICEQKDLFPFFDLAYQGFASGDLDKDAWPIRHFFSRTGLEFVVAQSFSKNFGLYGERVGALHIVTQSADISSNVSGKLVRLQRAEITSPPAFGARVVAKILGDQLLYLQWQDDLHQMSGRMQRMRQRLHDELSKRNTPGSWDHVLSEIGMFSMTGLSPAQVRELIEKYHVYLLPSGRISVTGLTESNVAYVAEAFSKVLGQADNSK